MSELLRRVVSVAVAAILVVAVAGVVRATDEAPAAVLIRAALAERLGPDVEVTVIDVNLPDRAGLPTMFRQVRLDPNGFLGKPIRVALVTRMGLTVNAVATLRVIGAHIVTTREMLRGETVTADCVRVEREELRGLPLRRLLSSTQVIGGRALRPLPAGAVVLPGAVVVRRAIEAGDRVTVVATSGDVEVSASLVAADAGDPGDVIRVVNPETRRDLRGRVVKEGLVEVNYAR